MATKPGNFIWMDGEFFPWETASIHPVSNTFQYGMGVFEGVCSKPGKDGSLIFRLHDHTDRLFRSIHSMKIEIPYSKEQINEAQIEAVRKNDIPAAYIRPMVYYGAEQLGLHQEDLKAHVMVAVWNMGDYNPTSGPENGLKLLTSSFSRIHVNTLMCKAKACGHYVNSILALREAKASGCDESLLLDTQGLVAEASTSNIFLVKNDALYTPTDVSILEGITRDTVFSIAKDLGIEVIVKNITRDEVYNADEIFLTGTAVRIKAVSEVDHRKIGTGLRGPITKSIQESYDNILIGLNPDYSHWNTLV